MFREHYVNSALLALNINMRNYVVNKELHNSVSIEKQLTQEMI